MFPHRVVALSEYADELSHQKSASTGSLAGDEPIPVVLFHDESVEMYEAAFVKFMNRSTDRRPEPQFERKLRFKFARARANEYNKRRHERNDTEDTKARSRESLRESVGANGLATGLPRASPRHTIEYMPMDEFLQRLKKRWFVSVHSWTIAEKIAAFGSPVVPIFAPLAPGETSDRYEQRFIKWLRETKKRTLDQLVTHQNFSEERRYRMDFAKANHKGEAQFTNPRDPRLKRAASRSQDRVDETKRPRTESKPPNAAAKASEGCSQGTTAPNYEIVGSADDAGGVEDRSLDDTSVRSDGSSASGSTDGDDDKAAQAENVDNRKDIPGAMDAGCCATTGSVPCESAEDVEDPIESKLIGEYDRLNDTVFVNEKRLEESVARLNTRDAINIRPLLELQAENEELRRQIHVGKSDRNAVVALLMAYTWRNQRTELEALVNASGRTNVNRIAQAIHRKCAKLSSELLPKQEAMAQLTGELEAALATQQHEKLVKLGSVMEAVETEILMLRNQRKHDLDTLIRFDRQLRDAILARLA